MKVERQPVSVVKKQLERKLVTEAVFIKTCSCLREQSISFNRTTLASTHPENTALA